MLNDLKLWSNDTKVQAGVEEATDLFAYEEPYQVYDSTHYRDKKIVIFPDDFIEHVRLLMSTSDQLCGATYCREEIEVFYDLCSYNDSSVQNNTNDNGTIDIDPSGTAVAEALDKWLVNLLLCESNPDVTDCAGMEHSWDECPVTT